MLQFKKHYDQIEMQLNFTFTSLKIFLNDNV